MKLPTKRRMSLWLTSQHIAIVLLVLGLSIGIFGFLNQHYNLSLGPIVDQFIADYYTNVSAELASIAITVLIIDTLNERRAEQQVKAQLIREMANPDNGIALRAVSELRARGSLYDGSLSQTSLGGANLRGANLFGAYLRWTNLEGANLEGANLEGAVLRGADLQGANLRGADLQGADLQGADLRVVNLQGADLRGANLRVVNLQGADLRGANLRGADLVAARLFGAKLEDAKLQEVIITPEQLAQAASLKGATMPDGSIHD